MSGKYHARFFEEATPHSRVKLRIYQTYLTPWSAKLGTRVPPGGTVWVVDGFAGRGRYRDGTPGSPEIAMMRSKEIAQNPASRYRLQCIFGDQKAENRSMLRALAARYPECSAPILSGNFWDRVDHVRSFVGESPTLLFVDPYGLLGINFDSLERLTSRSPKLDMIVNFRSPSASRLAPNYADRVSSAVGSVDWTPETVSVAFQENLKSRCGFRNTASLAIRHRFRGAVASEMILASHHPDAFELWNDEVIKESERLLAAEHPGQDPTVHRDESIEEVIERLASYARGKRQWQRQDLISWHTTAFCGEAHTGTIKRAVSELVRRGLWRRLGQSPNVDRDWFVWT